MIKIANIGMNHETAPIELRECFGGESGNTVAFAIKELPDVKESIFLSTCNRVETLYTTEKPEIVKKSVSSLMSRLGNIPEDHLQSHIYYFEDIEAAKHIFRVASSLDSMIVGEPQILGQIKEAYAQTVKLKASGVILNRLMHRAFHVAKRIRTETGISDAAVSISYAAVALAKKIFYDLSGKKVLLIGAGEMAELAAGYLMSHGPGSIVVANRTFARAVQIAEAFNGSPVSFDEVESQLIDVDIVISSTASTGYVVKHDQLKKLLRKRRNRPLFFIDIAVPRDVDPKVNDLENIYVYDIDDLKGIVEVNKTQRRQEAVKAERIIQEEVIKFDKWLKTLEVVPTIISLKEKAEAIRQVEIKKSLPGLGGLNTMQMEAIEAMTFSITEKIINDPILFLKRKANRATKDRYIDITRNLFNLDRNNDT